MSDEVFALFAEFYSIGDLNTPIELLLSPGVKLTPISVGNKRVKNQPGDGSATFSYTMPETANPNAHWSQVIQEGRVCVCWGYATEYPSNIIPLSVFIIENIDNQSSPDSSSFTISGPSLLDEARFSDRIFEPIGIFKAFFSTLIETAPGPKTTTVSETAAAGARSIRVADPTGMIQGDEIRVTLNSGTVHITTISAIGDEEDEEENLISLSHQLPGAVNSGGSNNVQTRRTKIQVEHPETFYEGDIIHIFRDVAYFQQITNSYLVESITEEKDENDNEITWLNLNAGLVTQSSVGRIVQRVDYSEPTPNDVATIMVRLPGWQFPIEAGRTSKTSLSNRGGVSPLSALQTIATTHGEFFYDALELTSPNKRAVRKIIWRHTCPVRNIHLWMPLNDTERNTILDNPTTMGILSDLHAITSHEVYNKVYVKGAGAGNARITLEDCSAEAINEVISQGFVIEGATGAALVPWSLRYPAAETEHGGSRVTTLNIDVVPETIAPEAVRSAAEDNMQVLQSDFLNFTRFYGRSAGPLFTILSRQRTDRLQVRPDFFKALGDVD